MSLFEIFRISIKAIRLNKIRALLTMVGVIIGVMSVIVLVSIVSGLGKTIKSELNSFGANLLVIFPGGRGGEGRGPGGAVTNTLEFRFADMIETRVSEVQYIIPLVNGAGVTKYKGKNTSGTLIYGVPGTYFAAINITIDEGRSFGKNESGNVAVIGTTVRDKLYPTVSPIGKEIIIKDKRFKVLGVQSERGSIFGNDQDNVVIIPLTQGRSLLGSDRPNGFFVKVFEDKNVNTAKQKIEKVLSSEIKSEEFTASTQEDTLALVGRILGILSLGLGGIAAISLLVGGVGIMNIMFVSVTERTREIGLRKALGARRRDILLQFLIEGVVLSVMGGLIGVILGILVSVALDRFIATQIDLIYVTLAFSFSAAIGIIFGITPAIKASNLTPIEALRYE